VNCPNLDEVLLIYRPVNINAIEQELIIPVARKSIESIFQIGGYFFLITQLDVFIRNDLEIDPCAINTTNISYLAAPTVRILQRSYKRNTWHKLVIMYGRLELLVTGGFYGRADSSTGGMRAFLGANVDFKNSLNVNDESSILIVSEASHNNNRVMQEERLPQNYARRAANYNWGFRSVNSQ
jgi:hypothetical protein